MQRVSDIGPGMFAVMAAVPDCHRLFRRKERKLGGGAKLRYADVGPRMDEKRALSDPGHRLWSLGSDSRAEAVACRQPTGEDIAIPLGNAITSGSGQSKA